MTIKRATARPPLKVAPATKADQTRSAGATSALRSAHRRHRSKDQRGK
jgi:hypothetical protein